jgi:lysozyme
MNISTKGLIEIMSHEGVCLSPYLDSVGVWTIGVGITKHDGKDPQTMGTITIDQAIAMFKDRIGAYVAPVQKLGLTLTQAQFDALVSFCYNVGAQNLANLCHGRTVAQIGEAFDLYHKPPEITERRNKEKRLFQSGVYSSNGKVLVFPVSASHKPVYSKGYQLDVSKYFVMTTQPAPVKPVEPTAPPAAPVKPSLLNTLLTILNAILRLFRR